MDLTAEAKMLYQAQPTAYNARALQVAVRLDALDWQPKETAPKDGQCFLAYCWLENESRPFYQMIGWDVHAKMCGRIEGWRNSCGEIWDGFTHWMPLPEPPVL